MKMFMTKSNGWLFILLLVNSTSLWAQEEVSEYITISGVVKDRRSEKQLGDVNIYVSGTNTGTITNEEGFFTLKMRKKTVPQILEISHIGYSNARHKVNMEHLSDLTLWLVPRATMLKEVVVYAGNPRTIIEKAIDKITDNYSQQDEMLTGFYRETAQKGRRHISISEGVMDIFKTSYLGDCMIDQDKVQILKGRRLLSQKASDSLAVKVAGGPNLSVNLDIVKNGDLLLNKEFLCLYEFKLIDVIYMGDREQYIIGFKSQVDLPVAMYSGRLYIDCEKLSVTRAEFNLDMKSESKAIEAMLRKKPHGISFRPQELSFITNYIEKEGRTYLNSIKNIIRFKCSWKKSSGSSNFAILTEIVITDRREGYLGSISYRKEFKERQVFYDNVNKYWDEDFWGAYNIIEPTESLEKAINKLKKQN